MLLLQAAFLCYNVIFTILELVEKLLALTGSCLAVQI